MARRNESILDLLYACPWWVSVVVSGFAYGTLQFIVPGIKLNSPLLVQVPNLGPIFAPWVALVLLLPAPFSFLNSIRKKKLLDKQRDIDTIRALTWKQFEELVGEAFRRQGYMVLENEGAGADGGVDLWIRKDGKRYLVQCKQWKIQKVGVNVVREMYGLVTAHQAAGAMIITTGVFTEAARDFAQGKPLDLIEGPLLAAMIDSVKAGGARREEAGAAPQASASAEPPCPSCGAAMVLRTARKGSNAGQQFWGCSKYPGCRGVINITR